MRTLILSIMLCGLTLNASAWQTFEEASKGLSEDKLSEKVKSESGTFYLTYDYKGPGISIFALNFDEGSFVNIRQVKKTFDVKVVLGQSLYKEAGDLYVRLLDSDGFPVKDLFISGIVADYAGTLYATFEGNFEKFMDVCSYEIHQRVK